MDPSHEAKSKIALVEIADSRLYASISMQVLHGFKITSENPMAAFYERTPSRTLTPLENVFDSDAEGTRLR